MLYRLVNGLKYFECFICFTNILLLIKNKKRENEEKKDKKVAK